MLGSEKHETHQEKSRACGSSSAMESEGQTYTKLPPQAASYLRRTKRNQLNRERTTVKLHLRFNNTNLKHARMTLFVNGANCGDLCMLNSEAIWFHHILQKGAEVLSPPDKEPIEFVSSGKGPVATDNQIDECVQEKGPNQ